MDTLRALAMNHDGMVAPVLPVAAPLLMAALLALGGDHIKRWIADTLAIATTVVALVSSLVLLFRSAGAPIVYWFGNWHPRGGVALGISFAIDPIGAGAAAFVGLLVAAALIFSLRYFDTAGTHFHALMLVFLAAMCGFTLTGDIFNLFVWFELMSTAAFALCAYKTEEPATLQGSINFAITNTAAAFLVLTGIALLYGATGALNLAQIGRTLGARSDQLVIFSFVLIAIGFMTKAAIFPLHFWLADAHAVAPTPVCVLFSGIMVQLGLFGIGRVYWTVFDGSFAPHRPELRVALVWFGALTAVIGSIMCFSQRNLKRLLAFSTLSHSGLLLIAIAMFMEKGTSGAAIYVLGHGSAKAALFLVAGLLLHRFGTVDELQLQGRGKDMPITAAVFALGGAALAGAPPFATFLGETKIGEAFRGLAYRWPLTLIFVFCGVLTGGAVLRAAGRIFAGWGDVAPQIAHAGEIHENRETGGGSGRPWTMLGPAIAMIVLSLGLGVIPYFRPAVDRAAANFIDQSGYEARVLEHADVPSATPEPEEPVTKDFPRAFVTLGLAGALAGYALWRKRAETAGVPFTERLVQPLRAIHSGHIGDYIAWMTAGIAALGIALAVLLRR